MATSTSLKRFGVAHLLRHVAVAVVEALGDIACCVDEEARAVGRVVDRAVVPSFGSVGTTMDGVGEAAA